MRFGRVGWTALILVLLSPQVSQTRELNFEAEEWFEKGIVHYNTNHFIGARTDFQHVLDLPDNQRSSAAQFMLAKCFYKLGDYSRAIEEANVLLKKYPQTRYGLDAELLEGDCWFRKNELLKAGQLYVNVLESPVLTVHLEEKAAHRVVLVASMIPEEQLPRLEAYFQHRKMEEIILYKSGETMLRRGEIEGARTKLQTFIDTFPGSPFTTRAQRLLEERKAGKLVSEVVGCLCPLSGFDAQAGRDLRDGVQLAQEEFGSKIDVRFEDTRSDVIWTIKATQKLVSKDNVMAIIGPVFGPATIAAAAVADCQETPLLAPTATDDMLTYIGPYIFQLNATPTIQGINVADYAVNQMGLHTFAILASTDPRTMRLATSFLEEVDRLGGNVVVQEAFYPETKDFSTQLGHIEQVAEQLLQAQTVRGGVETPQPHTARTIDAMLVAADPETIPLIVSQLATRRLRVRLLGGSGWHSDKVLRHGGQYVEGAVFAAEYYENTAVCLDFIEHFTKRFGRRPTKTAAFGYDAMMLINTVYARSQARSRIAIRDHLVRISDFTGASGAISFEKGRANSKAYILQIRNGRVLSAEGAD